MVDPMLKKVSTGIVAANRTDKWIEEELRRRANRRGLDIDTETILITTQDGMKVGTAMTKEMV